VELLFVLTIYGANSKCRNIKFDEGNHIEVGARGTVVDRVSGLKFICGEETRSQMQGSGNTWRIWIRAR